MEYTTATDKVEMMKEMGVARSAAISALKKDTTFTDEDKQLAILEVYGDASSRGSVDWSEKLDWFEHCLDNKLTRKETIAYFVEKGMGESTAKQDSGYLKLVQAMRDKVNS